MNSYSSFYATSDGSIGVSVFGYLYYGALLIFVIFLILIFVNFTVYPIFALTPNDPGIIVISGAGDRELAYTTSDQNPALPGNARNKKIPQTTLPDICNYTLGVDILISTITPQNQKTYPIPIFYRDSAAVTTYADAIPTALASTYRNTNIIVWADGTTKDIQVTLITTDSTGAVIHKSMDKPITQIYVSTWFRLTLVVASSFTEVYVNGSLISTINTANTLKQIQGNDFYPPPVASDAGGVQIANMAMWPRLLTAKEIRVYESKPMSS
jgi:hypothetical protein